MERSDYNSYEAAEPHFLALHVSTDDKAGNKI